MVAKKSKAGRVHRPRQTEAEAEIDRCLGALIKAKRKAGGMTQTDLAKQVGITFQQIQKYESGINRVSVSRLVFIAQALDISPESIVSTINPNG